jgi:hypothetical protein
VTVAFGIALSAIVPTQTPSDIAFSLGLVIACILGARGWWVATRPEPFAAITGGRHLIGVTVRVSAIGAAIALGSGAVMISATRMVEAGALTSTLTLAMGVAAGIAGLVHAPAAMAFELHIARLSRDARLAKSCKQGTWLFPAGHLVYALTAFVPGVQPWIRGVGGGGLPWSILGLMLAIIVAVAGIVTLVTPFAYALLTWRTFRHARASLRRREAAQAAARTAPVPAP